MVTTTTFSSFVSANLSDSSNAVVGLASGANVISAKWPSWSTAGRPSAPFNGLLGFNTTTNVYEFYSTGASSWVSLAAGGTILSGSANQLAFYSGSGTTLSGLPLGQIPGTTTSDNANAGNVGQFVDSGYTTGNFTTTNVVQNLVSASLTAGDWDVDFIVLLTASSTTTAAHGGITTSSSAAPATGIGSFSYTPSALSTISLSFSGTKRISLATTSLVYLNGIATWASGTAPSYGCEFTARRRR